MPGISLGLFKRNDLLQAAFHAGARVFLAYHVERLARSGKVEDPLLNRAGKIEKIGALNHKNGIKAGPLHQPLQVGGTGL